MKLWPETRRTSDLTGLLISWLGLSLAVPLVIGFLTRVGPPPLSEILFRAAPDLGLGMVISVVVLILLNRSRSEHAAMSAVWLAMIAAIAVFILSLTKAWDSTYAFAILKPGEAFISILSLGFWPLHYGPYVLDRFFPLAFALGTAFILWRQKQAILRILASALIVYLSSAFLSNCLSWISAALAKSRSTVLEDVQDVYRILVSVQSGGYWVSGQAERFFAATGHQAETGLMAARAAVIFLAACLILLGLAWRRIAAFRLLAKRFITLESTVTVMVLGIGLGIGWVGRSLDRSYTNLLSTVVLIVSALAWVYWRRLLSDLENLPQDELRSPHLPLPSGAVAPHDLEDAESILLVVALFGSSLLGWPVFAGFAAATFFAWCSSRSGLGWGTGLVSRSVVYSLAVLALGQASLAFGLRNSALAGWQVWALFGAALLAGSILLVNGLKNMALSRAWSMAIPSAGILVPLLVIRQPVLWGLGLAAIFIQLAVGYRPAWYSRFALLPAFLLLVVFAIFSVFWPALWITY